MNSESGPDLSPESEEFRRNAARKQHGFLVEFLDFLRYRKKWWLAPIILTLLALGAIVALGGSPIAPFIYTLF